MEQIILNGFINGLHYALVALGFGLIYNGAKAFHISHGAIYVLAPYLFLTSEFLLTQFHLTHSGTIPLVFSIVFVFISIGIFSYVMEISVYRPLFLKKAPSLATFISSLGLYIILTNIIALFFGNETRILMSGLEPTIKFFGLIVTRIQLIQLSVSLTLIAGVFALLKKTHLGKVIRAISDNATLANVLGVDVKRTRTSIFLLASGLAASAALLKSFEIGVNPYVGLSAVLTGAVAFILGGTGSQVGTILAAVLLGISHNIVVWFLSTQWQDAVTFVALILVLLIRREGLVTLRFRLEER